MILILLIVLILLFGFGGNYYNDGALRGPGFGIGTVLLILLIFLYYTGRL